MLSDTWLKAQHNRAHQKRFERADRDGLSVRITPKGKITFQVRFTLYSKQSRIDLGSYPAMSLKKARDACLKVNEFVSEGYDPREQKRIAEMERQSERSVKQLFMDWYDAYCIEAKANHAEVLRTFEIHVFKRLGSIPAGKASTHMWVDVMESVKIKTPAIAERILVNAKQMYRWAHQRGFIDTLPIQHIFAKSDLRIEKQSVSRVLNDDEIRLIWTALEESRITRKNAIFVKLCLMYGCRNGELRLSNIEHWDGVNGIWTVPPENHKTGKKSRKPILRPFFDNAVELVDEAKALSSFSKKGPVFCNKDSMSQMSDRAPLQIPYNIMQWAKRHKGIVMEHWSMHDLRRTMRTRVASLTEPHIAEIMIGHVMPGQWKVYDHYSYLEEQRAAYHAWWALLDDIISSH